MATSSITRRALKISTVEGSWATVHFVLTSGAFFTGYALWMGANDLQLGLLAAIPLLAQVFQIPGAYLVERWGHRRVLVAWFSVVARTLWLPIALVPLLHARPVAVFMALYAASSVVMNFAVPGWVAWMSALVPPSIRGRYFGMRNRLTGVVSMVALITGGWIVDAWTDVGRPYLGFGAIFLIAVAAGLVAFGLILRQPDPEGRAETMPAMAEYLFRPLRDDNYRRLLVFYLYWFFAVNVAAPFFNAHLLKHMGWNQSAIAVLGIVSSAATILCQTAWGRMVDHYGHKPVLMVAAVGIIPVPLFYAFCPWSLRWPIYVSAVLGGVFWAGFGLASFNQLMHVMPARQRTMYAAMLAALSGLVTFSATVASGWMAHALEPLRATLGGLDVVNYQVLFLATGLLRVPGLLLLRRVREPEAPRTGVFVKSVLYEVTRRMGLGRFMLSAPVQDGGTRLPGAEA